MVITKSECFNKTDLLRMIEQVSADFTERKGLTIYLFDNLELAESFASGDREYVNIASDIRGKYMRGGGKEFLIFSPRAGRLGDLSEVVAINLSKEKQ